MTASDSMIESDRDFFAKAGPLPTDWDDARRFPRFYFRGRVSAKILPLTNAPQPEATECTMLSRDLSRGGINLLHTAQLFPGQRIEVVLTDGSPRLVEVSWCRRIASRCFTLGCRFVRGEENRAADEGTA
jgi:hypothetical protein